jgi:hypothetical protein
MAAVSHDTDMFAGGDASFVDADPGVSSVATGPT